ncbi:MAG: cache domain-containing protein [Deltaproteobacteria bacterium]|nr:cache domain-containing protein [Deltaproteobacteria bacterium]
MIKLKFWIYSLLAVVLIGALFAFTAKFFLADLERGSSARLERAVVRLAQAQTQRQAAELDYARTLARDPAVLEAIQAARRLAGNPPTSNVTRAQEAIAEVILPAGVRPALEVVLSTPSGASRARVGESVEEGASTEDFAWLTAVHAGDARSTMYPVGEGNVLAVASAPVAADGGEPLGAITLFFPVDAGLLTALRSQVGVEVTVARGQAIVASSGELNDAGAVALATKSASPDDAVPWGESDQLLIMPYLVQVVGLTVPEGYARKVPLPGVADAVLIATVSVHDSVAAFDEIALYWMGGAGGLLALSLIWAFFVASGAGGKWAKRLVADIERSVSGDTAHRLEPRRYSRAFRPVAEAINAALEGAASRAPGLADQVMVHRDADIGSVLGDHPAETPEADHDDFGFGDAPAPAAAFGGDDEIAPIMPGDFPGAGGAPDAGGFDPFSDAPAPAASLDPPAPPPADGGFDPFSAPAAAPPAAPAAAADPGGFDPFADPAPAAAPAAYTPPAPPPAAPAPASDDPFATEMESSADQGDYFSDSTRVVNLNDLAAQEQAAASASSAPAPAAAPDPFAQAAADPFAAAYGEDGMDDGHEGPDATVVAKVPDALLAATARAQGGAARDPDEEHFKQVFQDFVATRRQCGEGADGLTFDKFAAKLRKNRDAIKGKHGARSVRFQVYVKAGKAALKATPVK